MSRESSLTQSAVEQSIAHGPSLWRFVTQDTFPENWRRLAWVNSVCCLFLVVGIVGIKNSSVGEKKLIRSDVVVPIVLVPPPLPERPRPKPVELFTTPSQQSQSLLSPAPPVVAVAEQTQVAFPIPVEGPVTLVAPRYVAPPPVQALPSGPKPQPFDERANTHGYFPKPKYPPGELGARHQGRVLLAIEVDTDGKVQSATVKESSGWPKLDSAALEKVRKDWDFDVGPMRSYYVPVVFQIQ
jgi:TonB family protein